MYLTFGILALAWALQGLHTLRLEGVRADDVVLVEATARQRVLIEQLGRDAALLSAAGEPADRAALAQNLHNAVVRAKLETQRLDGLLAGEVTGAAASMQPGSPAWKTWRAWQQARERLWARSQDLLTQVGPAGAGPAPPLSAVAVQAEMEVMLAAAQALSNQLRLQSGQRAEQMVRELRWGMLGTLVLLAVLSLVAVEPTARAVRRHSLRLKAQAAELRRLAQVAEHTAALVLITDAADRVVWVNGAFERATGWLLAEAQGRPPDALLEHPLADASATPRWRRAVQEAQSLRLEHLHRSRDGRDLWLDVDLSPLHDEHGQLQGFVRVCADTTARVQQQAKLQALWAALPAGVLVLDARGTVVDANREAERMLGVSAEELQALPPGAKSWTCVRADGTECTPQDLPVARTLRSGQAHHNENVGVHLPDGHVRWLTVNTQPTLDSSGKPAGVVVCFSDVTESRELQQRLKASARTDALTRLPNRTVVTERLLRAIAHARRHRGYGFSVLFMDFDRFKQVNDTLGHGAGDELLRQVARRLTLALRPGDAVARMDEAMAARLGGDEFVVVLDGVADAERASSIAQRLLDDLGEPYLLDNSPVESSVSIGVVVCANLPAGGSEVEDEALAEEVLRDADTAMYEAKRAGRGRWVLFDDSMHERVVRLLALEADLRRALQAGELFVVYQPVVELSTRRMAGVEALVRWQHTQRGLVPPMEFIPIAEECGFIDAVGAFVLETACRQFVRWQAELGDAAPGRLAVNLSRAQLKRHTLVDEVRAVLEDSGMQPAQLQLEVTESLAAQDEKAQATLRELKQLGVRLALDDFGTGYSSLACLHQMPVDTVKVDKTFVKHAETVEYHRVLIEATIRVARTMGMTTVAEGIETEGQADLMRELTCDTGQGYLFSHPLVAAELAHWARRHALQSVATA